MVIQHNMNASYVSRIGKENQANMTDTTAQLSSGYRIIQSKFDSAGHSISQKMRGQIRGLDQATRNSQDGISLLDVADGAAGQIHSMLQRMRELSVQSANDVYLNSDRALIQQEMDNLVYEVDRVAAETTYNTKKLLDGSLQTTGYGLNIQVGANSGEDIEVLIDSLRVDSIGIKDIDVKTQENASSAIKTSDDAIDHVSNVREKIGSIRNQLTYALKNTGNMSNSLQDAESRIADTDMAEGIIKLSKESILQNAVHAMLSQSVKSPNSVVSLLKSSQTTSSPQKSSAGSTTSVRTESKSNDIA